MMRITMVALMGITATPADADGDGMPDAWERERGSTPPAPRTVPSTRMVTATRTSKTD
jgi:hypothetical protein